MEADDWRILNLDWLHCLARLFESRQRGSYRVPCFPRLIESKKSRLQRTSLDNSKPYCRSFNSFNAIFNLWMKSARLSGARFAIIGRSGRAGPQKWSGNRFCLKILRQLSHQSHDIDRQSNQPFFPVVCPRIPRHGNGDRASLIARKFSSAKRINH